MGSRLFWRRSATAAGLYAAVLLGILGTVVAARLLGLRDFGLYATVTAAAGLFQTLLDLTVEESLTKYGFRYATAEDWGRLRRLFDRALRAKIAGGVLGGLALVVLAPFADGLFDAEGLTEPLLVAALLPVVQSAENVATTVLLLRGRYDLRGAFMALSMALRLTAIAVGAQFGVTETIAGLVVAQAVATGAVGLAGLTAFGRFPRAEARPLADDRREIVGFVVQSSLATGMLSLRTALAPLLLGLVSGPVQVGLFRVAQAPQSGFTAASSPVRLILLTEQTRDWERGRRHEVLRGVNRYMAAAAGLAVVTVPIFLWLMGDLVRLVFGDEYAGAIDAARIVLLAAAVLLVFGWTKSLPVTIGRPRLRLVTHGIETLVLLPLIVVLGLRWDVTGAAAALLAATLVFAAAWTVVLVRLHGELSGSVETPRPRGATVP